MIYLYTYCMTIIGSDDEEVHWEWERLHVNEYMIRSLAKTVKATGSQTLNEENCIHMLIKIYSLCLYYIIHIYIK